VAPTWHRPDCPPALEALILRLLEKDPSKRPASAAEVREALTLSLSLRERGPEGEQGSGSASEARPSDPRPLGEGGRRPGESDPLYRRTFVGRETELRQLRAAFDAALSGQGALAMVVGEPGIGKTSVCEQLTTYASLRGAKTLIGHCYEEGSLSLPYLPFVEAMRSYVLAREVDGLRKDLGSGATEVARIVSEVRDKVQVSPSGGGDPEEQRWRLFQAVTGFLRNASLVQPLLLILEDLHDADRGTLDLLLHVSRNLEGARLLIVGTYRDVEVDRSHPLSAAVAELRRAGSFLRVPLRGLTVDEVHRMYEAIRGNDVPMGAAELVHRQTEGNPLFVQEVLRYLVEAGYVVRESGEYVARQGAGQAVPEGLRDVVGRRLNRLSEQSNQVLSIAAVVGREFRLDVLQNVTGQTDDQLYPALEEAQERAIIEQRQMLGAVGFRFTHAFFRQTLYEEIFAPRRIRIHQQVGRAMEEVHARRLEEHATELAEHFAQSTEGADLTKAVTYARLAASRAMSVFDYGEAVRLLEQALKAQEVLDPDDRAKHCDLLLVLGEAQLPLGEPRRVIDVTASEAFALATQLGDNARASRACRLALEGFSRERNLLPSPGLDEWAERADRTADPETLERVYADVALGRLKLGTFTGPISEGLRLLDRGLDLARRLGDVEVQFLAAWQFIFAHFVTKHWQAGRDVAEEFLSKPRHGVSTRNQAMFYVYAGATRLLAGDRRAWETTVGEGLATLAARSQDINLQVSTKGHELLKMVMDGHLEDALEAARNAADAWLESRVSVAGIASPARQAAAYLGREVESEIFARGSQIFVDVNRAHEGAESEEMDEDFLRTYRAILNPIESDSAYVLRFFGGYLAFAVRLGEKQDVRTILNSSDLPPESFSAPLDVVSMGRLYGLAEAFLGEVTTARQHLEQAIEACRQLPHRPELALASLQLAELLLEHYPDERDSAMEHLDFAIAEFREMKMQPSLERALRHRGLLKA
jgi:hypothetical protein